MTMPKEATNKINFSCGDVYQVHMPMNFTTWATDVNKTSIARLFDVQISIDSILKVQYNDGSLIGTVYYLSTNLTNAYSYYPEAISSEKLLQEMKQVTSFSPFNMNTLVKNQIENGITLPF